MRLHGADLAAVAEIAGRASEISVPPFSTQAASGLGVLGGEHDRVGGVDGVVVGDVVDMHPVGLEAVVEEAAIGAPHGLAIGLGHALWLSR